MAGSGSTSRVVTFVTRSGGTSGVSFSGAFVDSFTVSFAALVRVVVRASRGTRNAVGAVMLAALILPGFEILRTARRRVGCLSKTLRATSGSGSCSGSTFSFKVGKGTCSFLAALGRRPFGRSFPVVSTKASDEDSFSSEISLRPPGAWCGHCTRAGKGTYTTSFANGIFGCFPASISFWQSRATVLFLLLPYAPNVLPGSYSPTADDLHNCHHSSVYPRLIVAAVGGRILGHLGILDVHPLSSSRGM